MFLYSIPWIPVEYISQLAQAKEDYKAEIWAFSTTLWEIFSHGIKPTVKDVCISNLVIHIFINEVYFLCI